MDEVLEKYKRHIKVPPEEIGNLNSIISAFS